MYFFVAENKIFYTTRYPEMLMLMQSLAEMESELLDHVPAF